jgi:hypothetical protein
VSSLRRLTGVTRAVVVESKIRDRARSNSEAMYFILVAAILRV